MRTGDTPKLRELRERIAKVGLNILDLANERTKIALDIVEEKTSAGFPLRDDHREAQLLEQLQKANAGPLDSATIKQLFRTLLDATVSIWQRGGKNGLRVGANSGPPVRVTVNGREIGPGSAIYIAGPCSIESEEQLETIARGLARCGVGFLRGGAFKPRTSPYAFQGLGEEGLRIMRDVAHRHGMGTVTEATSETNLSLVVEYADIIQIGARNMFNYDLLREAGQVGKPVLLKRSFSATLDEWLNAAEYLALGGNEQIILCERGIRTFARETRATLDLSIVPLAVAQSRLPVIVDVSHAAGRRDILTPLARAAFAAGANGVMIEVHHDPDVALSDAKQQLNLQDFIHLQHDVVSGLREAADSLTSDGTSGGGTTDAGVAGGKEAASCV